MRHYYTIIGYDDEYDCHILGDDSGTYKVDIKVDGTLKNIENKDLVGRRISVSYMFPFVSLAAGVKLEEK